jgi:hypothetical protein
MTLKVPAKRVVVPQVKKRIHFNTKINFDTRKRLVLIAF